MKVRAFKYPQDPVIPNHEVYPRVFTIPDSGNQSERFFLSAGAGGPHSEWFSWIECMC